MQRSHENARHCVPLVHLTEAIGGATTQSLLWAARGRVHRRLARAIEFPVVVVSAPSGFGKSTVLREYFAAADYAHRRLILAPKHADLLGFMRVLAACVADVAPALTTSFMGVYDRMNGADDAPRQIAQWAAGHLRRADVNILIDGLENAADERLFGLLTELVDQTSDACVQWIILTQDAGRFPVARWLADDRMDVPIDEVDLALSVEDLETGVRLTHAPVDASRICALAESAAHWPAAVALLLCELLTGASLQRELTQRSPYADFADRAFSACSGVEQRFLLETCLYRRFDREVLGVAGWTHVDSTLERLSDAGAFIYHDATGAYCYHELFRGFLEDRLRSKASEMFARIASQAAAVCHRVGRWSDALELYTDLQAATPLASLLSEHGFALMDRGEADTVSRALASLGENDFTAFPVALALKASLESLNGSFDVAEAWFRHAIKNVGDSSARSAIVFRFATDLVRRDRRDAIDLLKPIVDESGHDLNLTVSLAGLLATAYATHHMDAEAAQAIQRALDRMPAVDDVAICAKLYYQAGYVALFAQDWSSAKRFAQRALDTALDAHLYDIAARALSILYNVAMDHEDDIITTRKHLEELASCSIKAGSRYLLMYATLSQYEIEVLAGNLVESARLDATLVSLEVDYSVIATETLLPAQALRATWTGDFHRAYRLIAPTAEKQITPIRQAQRYAEIAVYAAAAGLREEAATAADRALVLTPKSAFGDKTITFTKAYVALALTLLGRRARAQQILLALKRAKTSARLEQLVDAFLTINERWEQGRYSTALRSQLDRLEENDLGGVGRLIEALPLPETFRGEFAQLTVIEREVLIHLSAGLVAEEIASLSGRHIEAVESSIVSLCRKLGCSGPRHAVALAQSGEPRGISADGN